MNSSPRRERVGPEILRLSTSVRSACSAAPVCRAWRSRRWTGSSCAWMRDYIQVVDLAEGKLRALAAL